MVRQNLYMSSSRLLNLLTCLNCRWWWTKYFCKGVVDLVVFDTMKTQKYTKKIHPIFYMHEPANVTLLFLMENEQNPRVVRTMQQCITVTNTCCDAFASLDQRKYILLYFKLHVKTLQVLILYTIYYYHILYIYY